MEAREIQLMLDELDDAEQSIRSVTDRKGLHAGMTDPIRQALLNLYTAQSALISELGRAERKEWKRQREEELLDAGAVVE